MLHKNTVYYSQRTPSLVLDRHEPSDVANEISTPFSTVLTCGRFNGHTVGSWKFTKRQGENCSPLRAKQKQHSFKLLRLADCLELDLLLCYLKNLWEDMVLVVAEDMDLKTFKTQPNMISEHATRCMRAFSAAEQINSAIDLAVGLIISRAIGTSTLDQKCQYCCHREWNRFQNEPELKFTPGVY